MNFTCYRGPVPHRATLPGIKRVAYGPSRFFFYNLFESDVTGAPLAVRNRARGSVDAYAAAVGRWLVTRDGFDFFVYYLSDFDYASHLTGPDGAMPALERADDAISALFDAAGGPDEFLARYDLVLCSDHGQIRRCAARRCWSARTRTRRTSLVTASNRAGMVYALPGCSLEPRALAEQLDGVDGIEVTLFREDGQAVARREREELRFARSDGGWELHGDAAVLDHPNGLERAWAALNEPERR